MFKRLFRLASDRREKAAAIRVAGETNIGLVRAKNEDSFWCSGDGSDVNTLLVVADGIGGHGGGDVASRLCCEVMAEEWRKASAAGRGEEGKFGKFMRYLVERANRAIHARNGAEHRSVPMGCTVVAAIVTPHKIVVGNAGDSRLYVLTHSGELVQLSKDHTLIARHLEKVASGEYSPDDEPPPPHVICRAVGPAPRLEPYLCEFERSRVSRLLLCSDGLTGMVSDRDLREILRRNATPEGATGELMCAALKNGGTDNVTIITAFCD